MSAQPLSLPEQTPPARPGRRRGLRPVAAPAPRRKPTLVYALVALAGAALIAVAQIGLTIATTQDSFVLADLTAQQRELTLQTHALQEDLAGVSSPQALASKASELGMVVAGTASYLRLSDGAVSGQGSGASWISTVDPTGSGAVANALLAARTPPPASETEEKAEEPDEKTPESSLPPTLEQGLPSPTTH